MREESRDAKRAARHVAHDVTRLREAYDRRGDRLGWTSWYVFARNLAQFFEPTGKPDYILAEYFIEPDDAWRSLVRERKRTYAPFMGHSSALANHLSWNRVRLEEERGDKYAPSEEVTDALESLYNEFLKRLSADQREWFESA